MNWSELDVDIGPGHYHFPAQAPRLPMRFRRAALMRGYDTEMGAPGVGRLTLTVHDRATGGRPAVSDDDLAHFDVAEDGTLVPR